MAVLNVNIDHVATIRQARRTDEPDPVWAAVQCELAGANGITVHLREDRRHINDRDVAVLKRDRRLQIQPRNVPGRTDRQDRRAHQARPGHPRARKPPELTTEGGLDCVGGLKRSIAVVKRMHKKGICVSAFIMPDKEQIFASAEAGCDAVELHTGAYANAQPMPRSNGSSTSCATPATWRGPRA